MTESSIPRGPHTKACNAGHIDPECPCEELLVMTEPGRHECPECGRAIFSDKDAKLLTHYRVRNQRTEMCPGSGQPLVPVRAAHKFSCDVTLYGPEATCNCGLPGRSP